MKNKIYVIGHKNPDTDSVCSALAYARYKEMTDGQNGEYIAMRAGELNPETEYVLNYFGLEAPALAEDVRPQLKDTAFGKGLSISEDISLKKAWDMLNKSASNTLTMTDGEGNVKGIISVGDIARSFMASSDSGVLSAASTPVKNVVETIGAQLVCGNPDAVINSGRVMIASTEADLDRCSVSGGDTVLLVDDEKAQKKAVINGAACIIVCLGANPATKIIKLAEDNGCALLKSPMDTLTTARMLNQSVPVSHFMKKEGILMFNEEDITEDVKDAAADTRHREFPVLDKEGKFVGVVTREDLIKTGKKKLILVDHNEKTQAVGGMTQADVLEVIDHHKIGRIETQGPIMYKNRPVGCTSTIIYGMYVDAGLAIPKEIAGAMCSAILSDTLLYRSPTCTDADKEAAEALAKIAGIDTEKYAFDMFAAGSDFGSKSEEEIFNLDYKTFNVGEYTYGVGQVQSVNKKELDDMKEKMLAYMEKVVAGGEADMVYLMLTDILAESSELLCAGTGALDTAARAFGVDKGDRSVYLKGAVSRKKQIIPQLTAALQK